MLALVEHDVADAAGRNYPAVVVEDAVLAMGALAAEAGPADPRRAARPTASR